MLRQNHHRLDIERMPALDLAENAAQHIDMIQQQTIAVALGAIHGEKIRRTFNFCTSIFGHSILA